MCSISTNARFYDRSTKSRRVHDGNSWVTIFVGVGNARWENSSRISVAWMIGALGFSVRSVAVDWIWTKIHGKASKIVALGHIEPLIGDSVRYGWAEYISHHPISTYAAKSPKSRNIHAHFNKTIRWCWRQVANIIPPQVVNLFYYCWVAFGLPHC